MKDMIGSIIRLLAALPLEMLGVIHDLLEKLSGNSGQDWLRELKNFLKKQPCWTGVAKQVYLRLISGDYEIDATDGTETLVDARDVFDGGIDPYFRNWGADEPGKSTPATKAEVFELERDGTFPQMFGSLSPDLNRLCLTPAQIRGFARKYRDWLLTDGYVTLFLYKSHGQFFVVVVSPYIDRRLDARVSRFGSDRVWFAGGCCHVVVPQLTT